MLGFALPGALIALTALGVPIVLHLWSRLTGRPLRVGSVAWFAAAPPPVARRPQIDDLWLLLVRCGILAALTLALAQPFWRSANPSGARGTWALVARDVAARSANEPLLDSLRGAGADIHVLGDGSIWSQLREADYEAPPGTRFVVVAGNSGAEGERPRLRAETQWIVPKAVTERRRGEDVEERRKDVRTVAVYSDAGRREDAKYVTAALRAAAQTSGDQAVLTERDVASVGAEADWIVWLAARPVPDAILEQTRRGATLLTDALGDSAIDQRVRLRLTAAGDAPSLRRRTMASADEAPLWTDDAGHAVLTVRREGLGRHLAFHARFHPSWGDLVLHPAFPEAMTALWTDGRLSPSDAVIAVSQLLPARVTATRAAGPVRRDLYHLFWLVAVLLFVFERVLARRSRVLT